MSSEVKVLELRDRATFIPVIAFKVFAINEQERYLMSRAGFGKSVDTQNGYVFLTKIDGGQGKCTSDKYDWGSGNRTFQVAHDYLDEHWDEVEHGAVIDVEFILGETAAKKVSEANELYG